MADFDTPEQKARLKRTQYLGDPRRFDQAEPMTSDLGVPDNLIESVKAKQNGAALAQSVGGDLGVRVQVPDAKAHQMAAAYAGSVAPDLGIVFGDTAPVEDLQPVQDDAPAIGVLKGGAQARGGANREPPPAGRQIAESVAQDLGVDFSEADTAKPRIGFSPGLNADTALRSVMERKGAARRTLKGEGSLGDVAKTAGFVAGHVPVFLARSAASILGLPKELIDAGIDAQTAPTHLVNEAGEVSNPRAEAEKRLADASIGVGMTLAGARSFGAPGRGTLSVGAGPFKRETVRVGGENLEVPKGFTAAEVKHWNEKAAREPGGPTESQRESDYWNTVSEPDQGLGSTPDTRPQGRGVEERKFERGSVIEGQGGRTSNTLSLEAPAQSRFTIQRFEPPDAAPNEVYYTVHEPGGRDVGTLHAFIDGGKATIENIASLSKEPNAFGPGGVRQILNAFRAEHPEIKTVTGERISGARFGGETVERGQPVSVSTGRRGAPVAAVNYQGEIFTGATHNDALAKAIERHPDAAAYFDANADANSFGLINKQGEYVPDARFGQIRALENNAARTQPGAPPPPPPTGPPGAPPTLGNLPRRVFSPQSVDAPATRAGASIRKETGLAARATEQARAKLEPYHKYINAMSDTAPVAKAGDNPSGIALKSTMRGYSEHSFDILERGNKIGVIKVAPKGADLKIVWVGSGKTMGTSEPLSFGPQRVRAVLGELQKEFPNAETISGRRVSGFRGKTANSSIDAKVPLRKAAPEMSDTMKLINYIENRSKIHDLDTDMAARNAMEKHIDDNLSVRDIGYIENKRFVSGKNPDKPSAIRVKGRVYSGETHADAIEKAISDAPNFSIGGNTLTAQGRRIADHIRDIVQERRAQLESLPSTEKMSFVEDYYPHLWEDPAKAQSFLYARAAKEGSGRSLKERSIPTVAEGIEAGLKPKTLNPIAATLGYVENMDRFIATNRVFDNAKAIGDVKYFPPGKQPAGWAPVNGRLGQRAGQQAYAPEGWARVYNNYVSRGIHEISPDLGHAYDVARRGSNAVSQLKLAISGYHLLTMGQESIASGLAKGIDELAHGRPIEAVKSAISSTVKPVTSAIKGGRIKNIYLEKTPGTPREQAIVKILTEAGGRMVNRRHAPDYEMSRLGSYFTAFRRGSLKMEMRADLSDIKGNPITGTARVAARHIGRILQTVAQPIFEVYIPRIKNAAAFEHMASWMERNPQATHEETMAAARQVVDFIDDRFGEMVQDNVFMNKAVKQVAQLTFLSWSWTLGGKIRALGGGATDMLGAPIRALNKGFTEATGGKYKGKDIWTPKMSYIIALPITYGFLSAIYQFLKTGEPPQDVQDLLAPRTGGTDARSGQPERLLMPGYMKDVFGFYENPMQEATNAIGPFPKLIGQTASIAGGQGGSDWRGDPILSAPEKGAPWMANVPGWLQQYFGFVLQQIAPISVGNVAKGSEKGSNLSGVETALGVRTAPRWLMTGKHYNPREPHSLRQGRELRLEQRKQQERQKQFPGFMKYGGTQ